VQGGAETEASAWCEKGAITVEWSQFADRTGLSRCVRSHCVCAFPAGGSTVTQLGTCCLWISAPITG